MRLREAIGVACLVAVMAVIYSDAQSDAIAPDPGSALTKGPVEPPVVTCRTRAQIIPPRRPGRVQFNRRRDTIAGPLVFYGAKHWGTVRRRTLKPDPGKLTPVKIPFLLKARKRVTVTISPRKGRTAELGVALDVAPYEVWGPSVELRSCRRKHRVAGRRVGPWTPYPAGYRIDGPMCLGVTVEVDGRSEPKKRKLAFGRRSCEST